MALTMLDPKTALIVIDIQKGVVQLACAHPMAGVIDRVVEITQAFRRHNAPVVLVNVDSGAPGRIEQAKRLGDRPADWAELIPELDVQSGDHLVTKRTWGAFAHTGLHEHLQKLGVTQVVIVGVATSIGVESTARQAFELGYNVTLATDAMTDMNADAHTNSVARIFPRLGETGSTAEVVALLARTRS